MQLHLCIGFLESRDGPFLGLREMVRTRILPEYPNSVVAFHSWRDDVAGAIMQQKARGTLTGPLILLGHSYGASALVRAAGMLRELPIKHLIMLDPVPRWLWGQFQWISYHLPRNVQAATCLYNPWSLPKSSPIRGSNAAYKNVRVAPMHAAIPGDEDVQAKVLAIIREECEAAGIVRLPPII